MIDLTRNITLFQISFGIALIALLLTSIFINQNKKKSH